MPPRILILVEEDLVVLVFALTLQLTLFELILKFTNGFVEVLFSCLEVLSVLLLALPRGKAVKPGCQYMKGKRLGLVVHTQLHGSEVVSSVVSAP